jgi:hypothetical protein
LAVGAIPFSLCSTASADRYWINGVSTGSWSNASNWNATSAAGAGGAGVPGTTDNVFLENTTSAAFSITLNQSDTILTLQIGDTGTQYDTLSQTGAFNLTMQTEDLGIGVNGGGIHDQSAGTNTYSDAVIIGVGTDTFGTYNLTGAGTVDITATGTASLGMYVGNGGGGTFNQSAGNVSINNSASLYLGYASTGAGTYQLSGTGSLTVSGSVYIGGSNLGAGGAGTFAISGGSMSVTNSLTLYANGTLNQTASGTFSAGSINQIGGAAALTNLDVTNLAGSAGNVGSYLLSGGSLTVNGSAYIGGSSAGAGGIGTLAVNTTALFLHNGGA